MLVPSLLLLIAVQASPTGTGPVSVGHVAFEPADLSVSYEQVVPLGTTYYKTQIVWRFSDGTSVEEPQEVDWFFTDGFSYVAGLVPVNPLSAQTLVPSTPERPARYVRKPKQQPPTGAVLIDVKVTAVASVLSDGSVFGDPSTVRQVFRHRQALRREYDYWLKVFGDRWAARSSGPSLKNAGSGRQRGLCFTAQSSSVVTTEATVLVPMLADIRVNAVHRVALLIAVLISRRE